MIITNNMPITKSLKETGINPIIFYTFIELNFIRHPLFQFFVSFRWLTKFPIWFYFLLHLFFGIFFSFSNYALYMERKRKKERRRLFQLTWLMKNFQEKDQNIANSQNKWNEYRNYIKTAKFGFYLTHTLNRVE